METAGSTLSGDQLHRLVTVGREIVSELDLPRVLSRVVETARALTGARYGALGVLDRARDHLEQFLTSGIDEATHRAIGDLPHGRGVLGVLIEEPRALRLADVGEHPRSYGFPPGHPPMTSFLGMPVFVRGEAWGNLYLTDKEGAAEFTDADEAALAILASWAGVAIDNAGAYRREHERRLELEQTVTALEATTAIARALGGETDLERILELIVKRGRNLVRARGFALLLEDGGELVVGAQAGELAPVAGRRLPRDRAAGRVLDRRRTERLEDPGDLAPFPMADAGPPAAGLLVPLEFRGRTLGVLSALDRLDGGAFTADDARLLEAFAASAASAVATAQDAARRELRRSIEAAESERRRWARELHDDTLQELAAVRIQLSSLKGAGGISDSARTALDQAVEQLGLSVTGLRELITDLRPATLDEIGVGSALRALAERAAARSDLEVELHCRLAHEEGRHPTRLVAPVEETIYRLVQEALTNTAKHAGATRAEVTLDEDDERVRVTVADDGGGFDPTSATSGFGLVGMRERVALVGGRLILASAPGEGTRIEADVPARHRAPDP